MRVVFGIVMAGLFLAGLFVTVRNPSFVNFFKQSTAGLLRQERLKTPSEAPESAGSRPEPQPALEDYLAQLTSVMDLVIPRSPDPDEAGILAKKVSLKTGLNENLPSAPFSLEDFKSYITSQEKFYKVLLPRSYKKSLEKLFKEQYLSAQQAFEAGQLLEARNFWVHSLAYPLYSNDPRKHKGVALKMLQSFTNDTLSKIGALNLILVQQQYREREKQMSEAYVQWTDRIKNADWETAWNRIPALLKNAEALEGEPSDRAAAAAYPPVIRQIDPDIAAALMDILGTASPSLADFSEMQRDVLAKQAVLQALRPEGLKEQKNFYENGMAAVRGKDWKRAAEEFGKVRFPKDYAADAARKAGIVKKIESLEAESGPKVSIA